MNTTLLIITSVLVGYLLRGFVEAVNDHIKAIVMRKIMNDKYLEVAKKLKDLEVAKKLKDN